MKDSGVKEKCSQVADPVICPPAERIRDTTTASISEVGNSDFPTRSSGKVPTVMGIAPMEMLSFIATVRPERVLQVGEVDMIFVL